MKLFKKEESGQSLLEMLLILPIFFMVLSGFIFIFQNQIRVYTDEMAQSALLVSEAHFSNEEKQIANWDSAQENSLSLLSKQAEVALNSSRFFKNSVDTKDGVFLDKKYVKKAAHLDSCSFEALFQVSVKGDGSFALTTCASSTAYESLEGKFDSSFVGKPQSFVRRSLYYPQSEFVWSQRVSAASSSALLYFQSAEVLSFSKRQSSLVLPDKGAFNARCFMEPFYPECLLRPIDEIISRSARDSSKLQISLCYSEAALACAPTGPGIPACLAGKLAQLINALELGVEAWVCPNTNRALKASQNAMLNVTSAYSSVIFAKEVAFRSEILINN